MPFTLATTAILATLCVSLAGAQAEKTLKPIEWNRQPEKASADPARYGKAVKDGYERVRAATAPFQKLEAAVAAGYAATVPNCLEHPMHGGMGYHHTNRELMDRTLDVEKPEILLYERRGDGSYALNGVEFIVPYRVWPADSVPPRIMDRELQRADDLKLWYMHMWVWKRNKAGLFANYNPDAACRKPAA
ncbi:MAG TPA: hypothetical protein VIP11_19330 [Gemmatimonadaceae bacterium]